MGVGQLLLTSAAWLTISMQLKMFLPEEQTSYNLALFLRDYMYYFNLFAFMWIGVAFKYRQCEYEEIMLRVKWGGVALLVLVLILAVLGINSAQALIQESYSV